MTRAQRFRRRIRIEGDLGWIWPALAMLLFAIVMAKRVCGVRP